jgi:hypothetical protein
MAEDVAHPLRRPDLGHAQSDAREGCGNQLGSVGGARGGIGIRWERRETSAEGTSVAPNEPTATPAGGVTIVVKEYKRQGLFDAYLDGRWLCRSHAPLLSAARVLLAEGIPPETPIMMRHEGSETVSLRSTVGGAAAGCRIQQAGSSGIQVA